MRVRELRKQLGLPVDALAQIAGVSQRSITLWEKYGLAPRSEKTIEKIARALGVEPDELYEDVQLFVPITELFARYDRAASELGVPAEELIREHDLDDEDSEDGGVSGV